MSVVLGPDGKPIQRKPVYEEVASALREVSIFQGWIRAVKTNDLVVGSQAAAGKGLRIYDEMYQTGSHYYSVIKTRMNAVLGLDWDVLPGGAGTPRDVANAEFIKSMIRTSFSRSLLHAIGPGISICEVMWAEAQTEWGPRIVIRELKHRRPWRFRFEPGGGLRWVANDSRPEGELMPDRKFVIWSYDPMYDSPWGSGVGQRCFWPWWFKKHGLKFWLVFADKYGQPTAVGKFPAGLSQDDERVQALQAVVEAIQQESAIVLPDNQMIELLEATRGSSVNTYRDLMVAMNSEMSKSVLGQTLTVEQGEHGALALGDVHNEVRHDLTEADAEELMEVYNGQLIPWACDFNLIGQYPRLLIHHKRAEANEKDAQTVSILVNDVGVEVVAEEVYERFGLRVPVQGEVVCAGRRQPTLGFGPPGPELSSSSELSAARAPRVGAELSSRSGLETALRTAAGRVRGFESGALELASGPLRVKRNAITALLRGAATVPEALERLDTAADKATAGLGSAFRVWVELGEGLGWQSAQAEAELQGLELTLAAGDVIPPDPEEAVLWIREKTVVTAAQWKELTARATNQAFEMSRLADMAVKARVKDSLQRALLTGETFRDWFKRVDDVYNAAGIGPADWHYAQNVFRTNTSAAYNAGRWRQFSDPDLDGLFEYYRYFTVGDDAVRDEHAVLDGLMLPREDPIWLSVWPPNGYQCRCTVTAVSESYAARLGWRPTRETPSFRPERGFETNPALAAA